MLLTYFAYNAEGSFASEAFRFVAEGTVDARNLLFFCIQHYSRGTHKTLGQTTIDNSLRQIKYE